MIILQESIWVGDKFCFIFKYTCSYGCNSVWGTRPQEKKLQSGLRLSRLRLGVESEFLSLIRIWARLGYCLGTQITHMVIIYVYI